MVTNVGQSTAGASASVSAVRPLCFLHAPKCGGTSVHEALLAALPEGTVSAVRGNAAVSVAGFPARTPQGREWPESLLGVGRWDEFDAISRAQVVSGHFYVPTLLKVTPPESIATVLREPRARLLSVYSFWRLTPGYEEWYPHEPHAHAMKPFDEFLSERLMAAAVDNVVCRLLLYGDPRVPMVGFIASEDIEGVAADAIDCLDRLGFVGLLEHGRATWEGLSRFFGVTLEPGRSNVTASMGAVPEALPIEGPIGDRTLELLDARTAADTIVYRHALMAHGTDAEAKRLSDSAFAAQLVRLGDLGGSSAASVESVSSSLAEMGSRLAESEARLVQTESRLAESESRLARLTAELSRRQAELKAQHEEVGRLQTELASHREWLEAIQGSASWRLTAPLRAVKRRVR